MIILTKSAKSDLAAIRAYYDDISLTAGRAIAGDITRALEVLKTFPDSGRPFKPGLKKSVTSKYRFVILHQTDGSDILIQAIFRYQNRTS